MVADNPVGYNDQVQATVVGTEDANIKQVNGTTVSVNSGVADAGTMRVVAAANVATWQKCQVVIAVTGTAVQLSATSQILQNGLTIQAWTANNANAGRFGDSGVTFTGAPTGSGNGDIILAGARVPVGSGINLNTIYVNGTAGDIFSWSGN